MALKPFGKGRNSMLQHPPEQSGARFKTRDDLKTDSFPKSKTAVEFVDPMMVRMIHITRIDGSGMPCLADEADIVAVPEEIEDLISESQSIDQFGVHPIFFGRTGCRRSKAKANRPLAVECCFGNSRRPEIIN